MPLRNFDIPEFLADYWQQKPLLIPNAFENWSNPITADELAGLALEEEVESRMVHYQNTLTATQAHINIDDWELKQGPFLERDFTDTENAIWTLLVQAVDHYIPAVTDLRNDFNFIPAWLIDDIMVSYATQHASVGPHFDRYDVFLIQGAGKREWRIGERCQANQLRANASGLSLIDDFTVVNSYELNPGDVLYLPPGISHWGLALDNECMTYSVGFRTPLESELSSDYMAYLQERSQQGSSAAFRFDSMAIENGQDKNQTEQIQQDQLDSLQRLFTEKANDVDSLTHWFGCWASQAKYETAFECAYDEILGNKETASRMHAGNSESQLDSQDSSDWPTALALINSGENSNIIQKYPGSRFYCHTAKRKPESIQLFINGREIDLGVLDAALISSVRALCQQSLLTPAQFAPWLVQDNTKETLRLLFDTEQLYFIESE